MSDLKKALEDCGALQFGEFTLASGAKSNYYIDIKKASTKPAVLALIAKSMAAMMKEKGMKPARVAGVVLGSIPLATALSLETGIPLLMVRKERKDHGTGRLVAQFFLERGFRNFGFFGFNDVCWSDERCEGFRREIEAAGFGDSFYAYRMQEIHMVWYYQRNRLREWLRSLPKPIAIMACDDNQGSNLIEACHGLGIRIPSEVSVMGVDNDESLCSLGSTTLSSVQIDIEEGGRETAALVERLVADPSAPVEDVVLKPVKVVSRMSTAAFATDDQQILKAILYIHKNALKKISVSDVMAEAALSRRLLERRFKSVTGKTRHRKDALRVHHRPETQALRRTTGGNGRAGDQHRPVDGRKRYQEHFPAVQATVWLHAGRMER